MSFDTTFITNPYNAYGDYDLPRQRTRCRVLVHSHIIDNDLGGKIDCSEDVINCHTSKVIKSVGNATFVLVPRRNYINYIFPNDWVNIYFDPGDGRGFIRTFFGFVDRIERTISVTGEGQKTTRFTVSCSDFTKAFDKTHIYFNPHIADRSDFVGDFAGTKNLAGALLRTKGITAYGSPADIVMNIAHVLLGFGAQFVAPPGYPMHGAYLEASRKVRLKWAKSRFSKGVQEIIGNDTIEAWLKKLKSSKEAASQYLSTLQPEKIAEYIMGIGIPLLTQGSTVLGVNNAIKGSPIAINTEALQAAAVGELLQNPDVKTGLAVEATAASNVPGHLLDIIDFSFVEYEAIDGSIVSTPIWTQQGTLWAIMNSYSNDIINELFCDLRPLSVDHQSVGLARGGYAQEPDEHGFAVDQTNMEPAPVRFVPALIMREYPFSTIDSIDANDVRILTKRVGNVRFGAIFSIEPGKPGRKIKVMYPALNDYVALINPQSEAKKHLDVVVIEPTDIISENVGRGDGDVSNLLELYSDGFMGKHMKFIFQDIQPISNAVSVARHGLRVRTYSTRFARFSSKIQSSLGVDNFGVRSKLARWALMLDHWLQHSIEYLHGSMTTRAFPEIRVGYRLDILKRNESYYVDGVSHSWSYPEAMTTTLTVSRGQRFDPYPVYVKPAVPSNGFFGDRSTFESRLSNVFRQKDPEATTHSAPPEEFEPNTDSNWIDDPDSPSNIWGQNKQGYLIAGADEWTDIVIEMLKNEGEDIENVGDLMRRLGKISPETNWPKIVNALADQKVVEGSSIGKGFKSK